MKLTNVEERAFQRALKAQENSYSPYSKFPVGASLKFVNEDEIFYGTNIENLSFGATICAERNAICQGVATLSKQVIEFIIVIAPTSSPITPCGMCLQVINEFSDDNTKILLGSKDGIAKTYKLCDFLGNPFKTDLLN